MFTFLFRGDALRESLANGKALSLNPPLKRNKKHSGLHRPEFWVYPAISVLWTIRRVGVGILGKTPLDC